jgi:hypothetical protein
MLKFTLKRLRNVSVQLHQHQGAQSFVITKVTVVKITNYKKHRCVVSTVVVWLRILLGPCWCMDVVLFGSGLLTNSTTSIFAQQ